MKLYESIVIVAHTVEKLSKEKRALKNVADT